MIARNDEQVAQMLMPSIRKACNYTAQKIWNDNRELIRQIVYEGYTPEVYERTGEFKEAWATDVRSFRNVVQSELKFDPRLLTVNYEKFQHGSDVLKEPMTTYLAEVIYQGESGPLFGNGPWRRKRDVWKALNDKLGRRTLEKYFEDGMHHAGLNFTRTNKALTVERDDIRHRRR